MMYLSLFSKFPFRWPARYFHPWRSDIKSVFIFGHPRISHLTNLEGVRDIVRVSIICDQLAHVHLVLRTVKMSDILGIAIKNPNPKVWARD